MKVDIIPFEGFDENLSHVVGLRASHKGKTTNEAHIFGKRNGFWSGVAATIVPESFLWHEEAFQPAEASLNRSDYNMQVFLFLTEDIKQG